MTPISYMAVPPASASGTIERKLAQSSQSVMERVLARVQARPTARELGRRVARQAQVAQRGGTASSMQGEDARFWTADVACVIEQTLEQSASVTHTSAEASAAEKLEAGVAAAASHVSAHIPLAGRSLGTDLPPELLFAF